MSGAALSLALGAALLHALWNVLLAGSRDSVASTGALLLFGTAFLAPAALLAGDVSAEALPFIAASAALELVYFVLLGRAYRDGELGVVYPVARGSAPVLVLVVAALGLGRGVPGLAYCGGLLVSGQGPELKRALDGRAALTAAAHLRRLRHGPRGPRKSAGRAGRRGQGIQHRDRLPHGMAVPRRGAPPDRAPRWWPPAWARSPTRNRAAGRRRRRARCGTAPR